MRCVALSLALLAAACAGGGRSADRAIQLSFEQLGSDAASRRGDYNYRTAVNVTGVSLPYSVGSMVSNPGAAMPELLALPQSYGCSKIVDTIYPYRDGDPDLGAAAVAGVSSEIDAAAAALAVQTAARLRLAILAAASRRADEIRERESDAEKAAAAIEADEAIAAARRSLRMDGFSPEQVAAARNALEGQLAAAHDQQAEATARLRALRAHPNLMVFRWSAEETRRAGIQLGSIFGGRSERGQARTGYVVLAHVRTAALSPGADMVWATELARQRPDWIERTFGDRYVTTFTLAARHVAFSEDRNWSALLSAGLNLNASELALLLGGDVQELLSSQSLQLEAALAAIVSASSQGSIAAPERRLWDFRMTSSEARQYSAYLESRRNNGYSVVYSTRMTIEEVAAGDGRRRVRPEFLRSERVHRCVHAVVPSEHTATAPAGGGQNETVTGRYDDVGIGGQPEITSFSALDSENRAIRAPRAPVSSGTILFCLPPYDEYQRDPFRSVNPDLGQRSGQVWRTRSVLTQTCVDLRQEYAPVQTFSPSIG